MTPFVVIAITNEDNCPKCGNVLFQPGRGRKGICNSCNPHLLKQIMEEETFVDLGEFQEGLNPLSGR